MLRRKSLVLVIIFSLCFSIFTFLPQASALAAGPTLTEYNVPTANCWAMEITAGPDGALWFTENAANKIGRLTTAGVFTEYPIPTGGSGPYGITAGPDGALWFAEHLGNKIGRLTTAGVFTEYPIPTGASVPWEITVGPDGALWFTEFNGNKIGRITTAGVVSEYNVPTLNSSPAKITVGPDGALWFAESNGNKIGRLTTAGVFTEYSIPTASSGAWGITAGPDGALWFTEEAGNKIGRCTTAGVFTEYSIPTASSDPLEIITGPDGVLWFTEFGGYKIGKITTAGTITEYSTPTPTLRPNRIVIGSDGALWFTESSNSATNKIGRAALNVFYFAEGYTGSGFQEYLCLGQPGTTPLDVAVTYLFADGTSQQATYTVPAKSRFTVNVNNVVGPDKQVSIKCLADAPFVAERPMYFNYTGAGPSWTGGHDAVGATKTSQVWYFAEGYTGTGFDEWISVLNPGDTVANLTFSFQTQEEGEKVVSGIAVDSHSRGSFKANNLLEGKSFQTSLMLTSTQPVVAERPMYFNYQGKHAWNWTGGHCVVGSPELATQYYFAEGTTRSNFEEWLTLQNPGTADISVHAVYQLGQGTPIEKDYTVPAAKRSTLYVPEQVGTGQDVSVLLASASPFLAERPMYFNYQGTNAWNWTGGHCVIGAMNKGTDWFFAEGYTGQNFEEWLCIQNPGATPANVTINYYPEGGGVPIVKPQPPIPPNSRYTVLVNTDAGLNLNISAEVVSDQPVIVERPMYFNYNGVWSGGHDVVGYMP